MLNILAGDIIYIIYQLNTFPSETMLQRLYINGLIVIVMILSYWIWKKMNECLKNHEQNQQRSYKQFKDADDKV